MPNYALVASNGLMKELLTPPVSSARTEVEGEPGARRGMPPESLEVQVATLRGVAAVHSEIQAYSDRNRSQMAEMIGIASRGMTAAVDAADRTTAAVERGNAEARTAAQALRIVVQDAGRHVSDTIEALRADFKIAMGELITLQQHSRQTSDQILESLQSPLETAARELRKRGERSYEHGWYADAYDDLIAAVEKNRFDYFAQRDLANLALFHADSLKLAGPPLEVARSHFAAAARYAEPYDRDYAAECRLYESTTLALQQRWDEARATCGQACELNESMTEARYQRSSLAAVAGDIGPALDDLRQAIEDDLRYWDRALGDGDFLVVQEVGQAVAVLLAEVLQAERERYLRVRRSLGELRPTSGCEESGDAAELTALQAKELPANPTSPLPYREYSEEAEALSERADLLHCVGAIAGHGESVYIGVAEVLFSPDSRTLVTTGWDNTIKLWDVESRTSVATLRFDSLPSHGQAYRVDAIIFKSSQQLLSFTSWDATVRYWDLVSREVKSVRRIPMPRSSGAGRRLSAAAFSPGTTELATGAAGNRVMLCRLLDGSLEPLGGHENETQVVAFSPDGRLLASGDGLTRGEGGDAAYTIKIWDVESKGCLRSFYDVDGQVLALSFSLDGTRLATSSGRGDVRIRDVATGETLQSLPVPRADIRCLAFSPDGSRLFYGSSGDNSLHIWDLAAEHELQTLPGHTREVTCLAFAPDGITVATGSGDNTVRLYRPTLTRAATGGAEQQGDNDSPNAG